MAASVEAAITAKLKATTAVNTAVGGNVAPQLNTQEPAPKRLTYGKLGSESNPKLGGGGSKKAYTVRVDCVAPTEVEAAALGKLVRDALDGWQDKAAGVDGAFHLDSASEVTELGERVSGETFTIWFRPTT